MAVKGVIHITSTTKCPVCGNLAKLEYEIESVGLVEEFICCDHCDYAYEFSYGYYLECVNGKKFGWGYTLYKNYAQMSRLFKRIDREMFMARRNWRKGITKKKMGKVQNLSTK